MTTSALTQVSHHLCPYVQRAAIALTEKAVPFERVYIDLSNRPDWFNAISPLGKVPLLKVGDEVIFESTEILEYLEETQPRPLHPSDPLRRARHRGFIEMASVILNGIWRFYTAPDHPSFVAEADKLAGLFARVEEALGAGPYFDGTEFSLVDAAFGPVLRSFDVFDEIGDFGILDGLPRLAEWRSTLAARPSIKQAVTAAYHAQLRIFLIDRRSYLSGLMLHPEAA